MNRLVLLSLAGILVFACSAKTERQTARTADGLWYHPSPARTGDGLPAAPVTIRPSRPPQFQVEGPKAKAAFSQGL